MAFLEIQPRPVKVTGLIDQQDSNLGTRQSRRSNLGFNSLFADGNDQFAHRLPGEVRFDGLAVVGESQRDFMAEPREGFRETRCDIGQSPRLGKRIGFRSDHQNSHALSPCFSIRLKPVLPIASRSAGVANLPWPQVFLAGAAGYSENANRISPKHACSQHHSCADRAAASIDP